MLSVWGGRERRDRRVGEEGKEGALFRPELKDSEAVKQRSVAGEDVKVRG